MGSLVRNAFDGCPSGGQPPPTPAIDEEWFEWHSLASAVTEARGRFVMAEIGAGYGRWAVAGGIAARRIGKQAELICVEAEPAHVAMLRQHFVDNDFDPADHRIIEAAASDRDGPVYFTVGRAVEWWGQAILPSSDYGCGDMTGIEVRSVPGVSLATALEGVGPVDLIDMDIQGAEADVISSSLPLLRERVRRIHIGTHSAEVEARIRVAMRSIDFRAVWDFPCGREVDTPIGRVSFQDGVQAWVRPAD
jgi:FkbM family methyltransferase